MRVPGEVVYLYIVKNCGSGAGVPDMSKFTGREEVLSRSSCSGIDWHGLLPNIFTYLESDLWKGCRLLLELRDR
jgi:hypothetical protein